ncbi:hypothetical protein PYW07_003795 [Mythimna separata]|uniref:C-type lectin domain-containing protein n=1 Tax=Mythimna separata TaxID=271217 RepID=A0AAD7YP05_MYTSE|nr:hypothetical protein PYW07_003795 [Mythimna separata]
MFSKTLIILLIVNFVSDSYGQKNKKFFRKDYTYIDATQTFYKINSLPSTWADAKRICALEGAIFWHPDNEFEAKAVIEFWKKTKPNIPWLWTAFSDILVEGRFETVEGKPSSEVFTNWQHGTPDNYQGNEDCTHMSTVPDMNDYRCDSKALFICKKTLQSLEWNNNCDMPNLDYTYSSTTGKCYKLHTTPLNWTEANDRCQLELSTLAVIRNSLEADYLVKLIQSTPKPRIKGKYQRGVYHLGFHNRFNEGWQTITGKPLESEDEDWFDNYKPDGEDECGSMFFNGRLINTDCDMKSLFICQHGADSLLEPIDIRLSSQPYVGGGVE